MVELPRPRPHRALLVSVVLLVLSGATAACQRGPAAGAFVAQAPSRGHVIAGRILDPQGLMPRTAVLKMWREREGGSFSGQSLPIQADGSFVTAPLPHATYILQVERPPDARTQSETALGISIVTLGDSDVTGVTIAIRPDTVLEGTFRMDSDNPAAPWPPHIVVNAFLALDGMGLSLGTLAQGASGGRFVLRNVFGPRVLRCGYTLPAGHTWWPREVLLDGVEITNVPTDFSTREGSRLEVVFTQHPARFAGTVTDTESRPVSNAWVVLFSGDPAARHPWSSMSQVVQADAGGAFTVVSPPGRYLARALPPAAFASERSAHPDYVRLAQGTPTIQLANRELKRLSLTVDAR